MQNELNIRKSTTPRLGVFSKQLKMKKNDKEIIE